MYIINTKSNQIQMNIFMPLKVAHVIRKIITFLQLIQESQEMHSGK